MRTSAHSLILSSATRLLLPLLLLYSLLLLLRGHDEPGGGFVGGLVATAALALHALAHGVASTRAALHARPSRIAAIGLAVALGSGLVGVVLGEPLLTAQWLSFAVPGVGKLGTPLLFDLGVYLAIVGSASAMLFALAED